MGNVCGTETRERWCGGTVWWGMGDDGGGAGPEFAHGGVRLVD